MHAYLCRNHKLLDNEVRKCHQFQTKQLPFLRKIWPKNVNNSQIIRITIAKKKDSDMMKAQQWQCTLRHVVNGGGGYNGARRIRELQAWKSSQRFILLGSTGLKLYTKVYKLLLKLGKFVNEKGNQCRWWRG